MCVCVCVHMYASLCVLCQSAGLQVCRCCFCIYVQCKWELGLFRIVSKHSYFVAWCENSYLSPKSLGIVCVLIENLDKVRMIVCWVWYVVLQIICLFIFEYIDGVHRNLFHFIDFLRHIPEWKIQFQLFL